MRRLNHSHGSLRPHRGAARRRAPEAAVAEVLGSGMLVAIAVIAAVGFSLVLSQIPAPSSGVTTSMEAFILPASPDRLVVEHRGGTDIPLRSLLASVGLDGTVTRANVGERIAAADPLWSVVPPGGAAKGPGDAFEPGDQLRYTNPALRGKSVSIAVIHLGKGEVDLGPLRVQDSDAVSPAPASARTTSGTTIEVTFSEPLFSIAPGDFTVTNPSVAVSAARLLGEGLRAELVTAAFNTGATPTVTSAASPAGTRDLADNLLQGSVGVVAADGAPPAITSGPTASAAQTTASITWGTGEAGDSRVEFGPTPALGRSVSDAALVTSRTLSLAGLSPGTLYYYKASTADAAGNRGTSALLTFTTIPPSTGNPSFSSPLANIIYPSSQAGDKGTRIGLSIMNPSSSAQQVDLVRFTASPTLGSQSDDKFFRGTLTTGAGSDAEFSCTWTGAGTDSVTCDPAGTFTLPAKSVRQVVLQFTTAKLSADAHTIVTGEVVLTSPAQTVRTEHNVRHMNGLHFDLLALSGAGGNVRAAHGSSAGGSPVDFHYRWHTVSGDAKLRTRFIVPAGWTDLSVPSQSSLSEMAVNVRQPTPTSQGYVDVGMDLTSGTRDMFFRVTPPAGTDVLVMQVDFEGSKEGSSKMSFQNLLWFGVSLT